jgi:hypothetical protein
VRLYLSFLPAPSSSARHWYVKGDIGTGLVSTCSTLACGTAADLIASMKHDRATMTETS